MCRKQSFANTLKHAERRVEQLENKYINQIKHTAVPCSRALVMENGFRKASAHSERARLSKWKKVLLSKALKENKAFKCIEKKGANEERRRGREEA